MRLIDADVAQSIADKELFIDEAGTVQFVLSHCPTIDPESLRPKGEWIAHNDDGLPYSDEYECSVCGIFHYNETNFCPNCGADMRGNK